MSSGFIKLAFNMKSLSEIETTVKRATKAIGYSWGVAEETAKCVRLLESIGLPGIKHINKYFSHDTPIINFFCCDVYFSWLETQLFYDTYFSYSHNCHCLLVIFLYIEFFRNKSKLNWGQK